MSEVGTKMKAYGPVLYCGDPHGKFAHIVEAAAHAGASAVVLLGDMAPARPMHVELAELVERGPPLYWIPGNHDADSDELWGRVWGSDLAQFNVHGQVVTLPDGTRLAGLGGVFREAVWNPGSSAAGSATPAFRSRREHAKSTPRQDRWAGGHHRKHWGTIYPDELDALAAMRADVLITHEAPGYHPNGFDVLDKLARAMGVKVTVHGHHHDRLDSSVRWIVQGFKSFGVGLRGITAIDVDGNAQVILSGEQDDPRDVKLRTDGR